jgi:hypothetical protein
LSEGLQIATLPHTNMAGELAALWTAVSSTVEFMLRCLPDETFQMEVMDELVANFQKPEERCSWLEWPGLRICDLLLGPPSGRSRLADHLDQAVGQLGAEMGARQEANAELEALQTLDAWVRDLVLDRADGSAS